MPRAIYSIICLLLIGLYLSCGTADDGSTSPSINYDLLRISSFSVVDGNGSPINDTNAISVDASFLLTFEQSLGDMVKYVNSLTGQIKLLDVDNNPITLKVEATSTPNQIKITPTTDLGYSIIYQLIVKKGLTINNYQVAEDIAYLIATEINYDLLGLSSFSVVDGNENPINDTNAIPVDASFLLTFAQSLENMANLVNSLTGQIKLLDVDNNPITLKVEPTQIINQIKIIPTTDLSYGTTYQLIVKEGLIIGDYRVIDDIVYPIATEKNSDSSLIVIYDSKEIFPDRNYITILLVGSDPGSVMFTLEVGEGATLQNGNNNLPLNESNQYTTNMDFSSRATHSFIVTAQDGSIPVTYIIGVSQKQADSKEILSFIFLERDHTHLKANIVMDVNTNSRAITKTVTNVEKITGLIPYIFHSGSNISPASRVAQDFSTNNTYTVTAIDKTTSSYTVTLTSYYGVTINTNGGLIAGAPTTTEYILYEEKASPPSDPSQEHYGFKGWYDAFMGGNIFDFDTPVTTQTIVYAQWTNKQYTVSFSIDGGGAIDFVTVKSLTPISRGPIYASKEHYVLDGWYMNNHLTNKYDFNWTVSNSLSLYAKYTNKQYKVNFDTDEGSTIASEIVNSLTPVNRPTDPSKEHYVFNGWYMNNSFTIEYDFSWEVSNNLTLYAKYTNKQYRVRFYQGGNPLETIFVAGLTAISASNYPTSSTAKQLYKWYSDSGLINVYDKHSFVVGNLDLYAKVLITDGTFRSILEEEVVPSDLANYDNMSRMIFSNYIAGADVITRYVKEVASGTGDGSSWGNASGDIQAMIDGDANANNVYVVLIASGTYKPSDSYVMKNYVALIGGFTVGSYERSEEAYLDGNNNKRVFNNDNNGLDSTALLYGVVIANGIDIFGGGMYNNNSSPTLINVTFSDNTVAGGYWHVYGGGMVNWESSPTLIDVIFSGNKTILNLGYHSYGGGMFNYKSSPTLNNVTFSNNTVDGGYGGGMYNESSLFPTFINVVFSNNTVDRGFGGGMYNNNSSSTLNKVIFSGNTAWNGGGGMYNDENSSSTIINVTFSGNTANDGGGMYNNYSSPTLINVAFSGNTADDGGGGMFNWTSSPTLINVTFSGNKALDGGGMNSYHSSPTLINATFSGNKATSRGGGIYHKSVYYFHDSMECTLINTILWNNNNGNIYLDNDRGGGDYTNTVNLYYSLIEGGTDASSTAEGIRLYTNSIADDLININREGAINEDPGLGVLIDNGGEVNSISIGNNSPAKDEGIYVRGMKVESIYSVTNLYYSKNNTDWYSDPDLTIPSNLPSDADDLTATDARGYSRVGRPDMGAYEEGGISP